MTGTDRQRVAVVTGGGGGIGAAIAESIGRTGAFVVTLDPLVSVDGSEQLPAPEETTAGRIVAAGGAARASSVSVTDADGVQSLFNDLHAEFGGLDAVVNVAGITRPTGFANGSEDDWRSVLSVHLDGYLNVLNAALPLMAAAGYGRILGVTSGSGWRPANAGAYSCAKRAVAALTWQLGRHAPAGVVVNAVSPIAATRMVTAALSRARPAAATASPATSKASATGGLSLASMPAPEELGPLGAHLVDAGFSWCSGHVIFAGGSEIALVDAPRLLEVVRTNDAVSLSHVLDAVTAGALVHAEATQSTNGGSNSRFATIFDEPAAEEQAEAEVRSCAVVTDHPEIGAAICAALDARGLRTTTVDAVGVELGFQGAADALASAVERIGRLEAVIVAVTGGLAGQAQPEAWQTILEAHAGIAAAIHRDASWSRAVSDYATAADRPVRLLTLTDATTAGGRTRAQAAAQLARSARGATDDCVSAFSVSVEMAWGDGLPLLAGLASHLLCSADTPVLSGAELVAGDGWFGLRSHPRPAGSITFGGPEIPAWFDDTLRSLIGEER